jgi:hypothetical protein
MSFTGCPTKGSPTIHINKQEYVRIIVNTNNGFQLNRIKKITAPAEVSINSGRTKYVESLAKAVVSRKKTASAAKACDLFRTER